MNFELTCSNCKTVKTFKKESEAFNEGWDYFPRFSINFVTCPNCSTAEFLLKE